MFRTIKFRAWDKVLGRFLTDEEVNKYPMGAFDLGRGSLVFTQYTGLCDKNGKKIYEDDFVKDDGEDAKNWQIVYSEGCFIARGTARMRPLRMIHCEVIGNFYENQTILCPR